LVINNQLRDYLLQFFEAIVLPKKWRFVERLPINNQGKTTHQQLQALFESKQPRIDKPTVTSVKEIQEDIVITLFIPADLYYFNGHFTSKPILAGVVQIDWAIFYGQQHFAINGKFNSMEVIKFHEFIEPESEVELTISYNASKNKLKFQYQSALGRHSSGRIVFG
jgi:3-hydroxymyristoyl/3-hydroxydecanoyl-(acyl carrier protein) dehydratase